MPSPKYAWRFGMTTIQEAHDALQMSCQNLEEMTIGIKNTPEPMPAKWLKELKEEINTARTCADIVENLYIKESNGVNELVLNFDRIYNAGLTTRQINALTSAIINFIAAQEQSDG